MLMLEQDLALIQNERHCSSMLRGRDVRVGIYAHTRRFHVSVVTVIAIRAT